jgi:phospholipid/cholesterol/gamma-HCH transport system substrate-binding protein
MRAPSKGLSRELQVGLFVFTALLVVLAFSFRITETPIFYSGTRITAYLNDATGLYKKSKVKMAGVDVGLVTDIVLEEGRARITLTIKDHIEIPSGSKVIPRPLGILGDKYIEIVSPALVEPKGASQKDASQKSEESPSVILQEGARLWNWLLPSALAQSLSAKPSSKKSFREGDVIPAENSGSTLDDLTRQLSDVSQDLKAISSALRRMLEGGDVNSPLGNTLKNTESLTSGLDAIVKENRQDLRQIVNSLAKLTRSLDAAVSDKSQKGLSKDIQSLAKAADRLSTTIKNIESITSKIDRGEGTLGRLVNDPVTANEFNKALVTLNSALDRAERTRIFLEAIPELDMKSQDVKTYVGLKLAPRDNTAYIGQLVVVPQGTSKTTITRTRVNGGSETVTEETVEDPTGVLFSIQYAKRFWNTSFRVGLFESEGGLALDQHLFKDQLRISTELFNFSKGQSPNLKFTAAYRLLDIFQIQTGMERTLEGRRFAFVGLGLSFSDEDLKTVLLLPGVP